MEILNISIIQNVRKFPQLYHRNYKFADRKKAWKFLAKSLKLDELFLKSRWHILRERYAKQLQYEMEGQHRNHFRYTKEMDFMRPHIKVCEPPNSRLHENTSGNWVKPEFVITAADLEMKLQHQKDDEELMFMEIEEETEYGTKETDVNRTEVEESCLEIEDNCQELEDSCNESEGNSQEIENNCNVTEDNCQEKTDNCNKEEYNCHGIDDECKEEETNLKVIEESPSEVEKVKEIKNNIAAEEEVQFEGTQEKAPSQIQPSSVAKCEMDKGITNIKKIIKVVVEQEDSEEKVVAKKIDVKQEILLQPDEIQIGEVTNPVVEIITKSEISSVQKPESLVQNTRCEDTIFGELIVAMLKSMDPVRKKSIKKEIMNLLLS